MSNNQKSSRPAPGQGAGNRSPSSKGTRGGELDGEIVSVTVKKPLGLSIGDSGNGNMISNIDNIGNAARWNEACEGCEFDQARVIRVGDRVVGISASDNKIVDSGTWSPMKILDFFTYRTGPVVTLKLQRSNLSKDELGSWLEGREGRQVFEPMLLPLNLKMKVTSPVGLDLTKATTSTGQGASIACITDGGSAAVLNEEAKKHEERQHFFNEGDMLVNIESEGGAQLELMDKSVKEVNAILQSHSGEFALHIRRPICTKRLRPRTVVVRSNIPTPTGMTLQASLFGTVVVAIEKGGGVEAWNKDKARDKSIQVGDYLIGVSKSVDDDELEDLEGACHDVIITAYNSICEAAGDSKVKFKLKRTFKN